MFDIDVTTNIFRVLWHENHDAQIQQATDMHAVYLLISIPLMQSKLGLLSDTDTPSTKPETKPDTQQPVCSFACMQASAEHVSCSVAGDAKNAVKCYRYARHSA